ncbi:unnamed protein product [Symbiodinium necroappetens]|uniref:C3H1-type domain-containing protein n=1 Tax=Symbiodinium necroappetens TaxID=1628268 RepID=A0A813BNN0_9DINO|nr:unnamed protein product [Symbiodinium necroappetens]
MPALDAAWRSELIDRQVPQQVLAFFENEGIVSASRLANYVDTRDEIMTLIVDKIPELNGSRSVKALLTEIWREADHSESLRLQRKAAGCRDDDMEDALPEHVTESLRQRWKQRYNFSLPLSETLCEPLVGRIKREIERKTHTLISVERVRSAKETARSGVGKKLKMSEDVTVSIASVGVVKGPRSVPSVMVYLSLLEILLHGYAYVGNFVDHTSNSLYCSLDCIREYLAFVKSKVAPLTGGMHSLSDLRRADEDSRTLWAEQMRSGKTFDEAVQASEAKVAALWLFASRTDVGAASAVVVEEDDDARPTKRPKGDPNNGVVAPPPPPAVANVNAEGKSICRLFNEGKCNGQKCKHGRLHVCNFLTKKGAVCGQAHRRCDAHKAR